MMWGRMSAIGKTFLAIAETKMKSERYIQILEDYFISFASCIHDNSCIFILDYARLHTSSLCKAF